MTVSKTESHTDVYTFLGIRNKVLITAEQSDGAFGAAEITVPPGLGPPLHTNTREALGYYGLEGALSFVTEAGHRRLGPGEFISLRKGGTHTFANKGDTPARVLMIASPGGFERFFAAAAAELPAEAPEGPPAPELIAKLAEISAMHGMELHP
jgi:quercetin dioxygenase-like cupin family protein